MDLGPHATIIWSAYIITALVLAVLVGYVIIEERRQRNALARLEEQGIRRRSDPRNHSGAGTS